MKPKDFEYKMFYNEGGPNRKADTIARVEIHTKETEKLENRI